MDVVLVVVTDIRLQEQIKQVLSIEKYQLHFANSSIDGYRIFKRLLPQIVIVDFELDSFKNGFQLIQYFQTVSDYFYYVLMIQMQDLPLLHKKISQLPPNSLLFKPIGKTQLKGLLRIKELDITSRKAIKESNRFTKSELRILELIQQQKSSKEIADILSLSEKTIKNHRYNICKKLDFKDKKTSIYQWLQQNKVL